MCFAAPEDERDSRHKRRGSFVGTAQFVSPEVLQNKPVTKRYYVMLFHMNCGYMCSPSVKLDVYVYDRRITMIISISVHLFVYFIGADTGA